MRIVGEWRGVGRIGDGVGGIAGRVDEKGRAVDSTNHVCAERFAFCLALLLVLFEAAEFDLAAGAGVGTVVLFGVADSGDAVGGFETDHALDLCNVVASLPSLLLFDVVHALTNLCASTDNVIELLAEEASTDPDHGDADGRDVADAHEDEEDGLLTWVGGADVEGDQASDGHGGYADIEAIDEADMRFAVASVEDTGGKKRGKGKDEDVHSVKVEVAATPTREGAEGGAGGGWQGAGADMLEHGGDVCLLSGVSEAQRPDGLGKWLGAAEEDSL